MSNSNEYIECPYCAESIKANAIKCKHCFSDLSDEKPIEKEIANNPFKSEYINKLSIKNPVVIGSLVLFIIVAIVLVSLTNSTSPIEDVSDNIYNAGLTIIEDFDKASVRTSAIQEMLYEEDKSVNDVKDVISYQYKIDDLNNKAQTENELVYVAVLQDIFNIQKQLITAEVFLIILEDVDDPSNTAEVLASTIGVGIVKELQEEKNSLFSKSFSLLKNATSIEDIMSIRSLILSSE